MEMAAKTAALVAMLVLACTDQGVEAAEMEWEGTAAGCCIKDCCTTDPCATKCKRWDDASCWSTATVPGPDDTAVVRSEVEFECRIWLEGTDVGVLRIESTFEHTIVFAHTNNMKVGMLVVNVPTASSVIFEAPAAVMLIQKEVQIWQGEFIFKGSSVRCADFSDSHCDQIPSCNMTISSDAGASFISQIASSDDLEGLCLNIEIQQAAHVIMGNQNTENGDGCLHVGGTIVNHGSLFVSCIRQREGNSVAGHSWINHESAEMTFGEVDKLRNDKTLQLYFPLHNAGKMIVISGDIEVHGGLGSGRFSVAERSSVLFQGGGYSFTSRAEFDGGYHCYTSSEEASMCGQIVFAADRSDVIKLAGTCLGGGILIVWSCILPRTPIVLHGTDQSVPPCISSGVTVKVRGEGSLHFDAPFELRANCGMDLGPSVQLRGRSRKQHANEVDNLLRSIEASTSKLTAMREEQERCSAQLDCTADRVAALDTNITALAQDTSERKREVDDRRKLNSYDYDIRIQHGAYMATQEGGGGVATRIGSLVVQNRGRLSLSYYEISSEKPQDELVVRNVGGAVNLSGILVLSKHIRDSSREDAVEYCGAYCCSHGLRLVNGENSDARVTDMRLSQDQAQLAACSEKPGPHRGLSVENSGNLVAVDHSAVISILHLNLGHVNKSIYEQVGPSIESRSKENACMSVYGLGADEKFELCGMRDGDTVSQLGRKDSGLRQWALAAEASSLTGNMNASNVTISVPAAAPVAMSMELHSNGTIVCEAQCAFASSVDVRGQWALAGGVPLVIESSSVFRIGSKQPSDKHPRLQSSGAATIRGKLQLCDPTDPNDHLHGVGTITFPNIYLSSSSAELVLCDGQYRQTAGGYSLRAESVVEGNVEVLSGHVRGTGRIIGNLSLAAFSTADLSATRSLAIDASSPRRMLHVAGDLVAAQGSTLRLTTHLKNTNGQSAGLWFQGPLISSQHSMQLLGRIVVLWKWEGSDKINISSPAEPLLLASSPFLTGSWRGQRRGEEVMLEAGNVKQELERCTA